VEIESLDELAALLAGPAPIPAGVCLQDLDLTGSPRLADRLAAAQPAGLVVLGGRYPPLLLQALADGGATVLPSVPGVPFQPYRAQLYRPGELYAGLQNGYHATVDAGCYRWFSDRRKVPDIAGATFAAIHDASITDALEDLLGPEERPLVAVMGGHGVQRGSDSYFSAAHLGSLLARCGALVATGGGPGAMEAVNLGAAVAGRGREDLPEIVGRLSAVPTFQDVAAWAAVALDVVDQLDHDTHEDPGTVASIGIPTWFYGHEPPNAFADRIAKYFSNALREDVLLARAGGLCCQGRPAPFRRSSRPPPAATTPPMRRPRRSCWSTPTIGPARYRSGRCCTSWQPTGQCGEESLCAATVPMRLPP